MDDNEQFVRARWRQDWIAVTRPGDGDFVALLDESDVCILAPCSWSEARAFTEARLKEIAEVEEEIALVQNVETTTAAFIASIYVAKHIKQDAAKEHPVWRRILSREQSVLAALKVGMKD